MLQIENVKVISAASNYQFAINLYIFVKFQYSCYTSTKISGNLEMTAQEYSWVEQILTIWGPRDDVWFNVGTVSRNR